MFALFSESMVGLKVKEWSGADLTKWDTGNVESFNQMFKGNSKFNGNVSTFQIHKATHLGEMFRGCTSFNGGLGTWDVSNVVITYSMFRDASKFVSVKSQDIPQLQRSHTMLRPAHHMRQKRLLTHFRFSPISLIIFNRLGPASRSGRREV